MQILQNQDSKWVNLFPNIFFVNNKERDIKFDVEFYKSSIRETERQWLNRQSAELVIKLKVKKMAWDQVWSILSVLIHGNLHMQCSNCLS